jgi:hypothetical protein
MIDIGYKYYFFGSSDSTDIDVMIDHANATGEPADKDLISALRDNYSEIKDWNINIISIKDGFVVKSIPSKGSPDSINNSLYYTYQLHAQQQVFPFSLADRVDRILPLAVVKCVRAALTLFKNSADEGFYKEKVRPILRSGNWQDRVELLSELTYTQPFCDNEKDSINLFKSVAFYIGQTISLFSGIEIYTKSDLKLNHPELSPIIDREPILVAGLLHDKLNVLQSLIRTAHIEQPKKHILKWDNVVIDFKDEVLLDLT